MSGGIQAVITTYTLSASSSDVGSYGSAEYFEGTGTGSVRPRRRDRELLLNARCRGCRSTSQMPKLALPSADTATAAVLDARSRLLQLAQDSHVYESLDRPYGYLRHADADPELVLLTLQGLVRLRLRRPRRTDQRQRSFLCPPHPDEGSIPAHLLRAIREEREVIGAATGASADGCDTTVARSTKDTLRAA